MASKPRAIIAERDHVQGSAPIDQGQDERDHPHDIENGLEKGNEIETVKLQATVSVQEAGNVSVLQQIITGTIVLADRQGLASRLRLLLRRSVIHHRNAAITKKDTDLQTGIGIANVNVTVIVTAIVTVNVNATVVRSTALVTEFNPYLFDQTELVSS